MRRLRPLLMLVITAVIAAQFVPVDRDNPPESAPLAAPAEVMAVLQASCFDCHSNRTAWPWYSRVAPVSWWVAHHVEEGREHLNFSHWGNLTPQEQRHARKEVSEEVREGKMPLPSYVRGHRDAALDDAERELLLRWARGKL